MDSSENLDFWAMVRGARENLGLRSPDSDISSHEMIISLDRASRLIANDIEAAVHSSDGHTWATFRYLFALWVCGPLTSNSLAMVTGMSRPQVSNMTQKMLKEGLVTRTPSEEDKRAVVLDLSDSGLQFIDKKFKEHNALESEWASGLTDIELQVLVALLDKIAESDKGRKARAELQGKRPSPGA